MCYCENKKTDPDLKEKTPLMNKSEQDHADELIFDFTNNNNLFNQALREKKDQLDRDIAREEEEKQKVQKDLNVLFSP